MEYKNTFRYLIKIAGQILFVIGLVLNILIIFFGFWPSLIYVFIMLAGAGMFSLNRDIEVKKVSVSGIKEKMKPLLNVKTIAFILQTVLVTILGFIVVATLVLWLLQDYFKRRDTRNDCNQITVALYDYYKQKNKYPDNLAIIINTNPLRQTWNKDSWGNPYHYKTDNHGTSFTLISLGKDGKFNTDDDMAFRN